MLSHVLWNDLTTNFFVTAFVTGPHWLFELFVFFFFFFFFFFFLHTFYNCIVPMGFLPREIQVEFSGESQLRQSLATQPTEHAECFSVSIIHRTLTRTTGSLLCSQMKTHAIAHEGVCGHRKRVCSESRLWERKKSLAAPGNRTCVDSVPVRCSTNCASECKTSRFSPLHLPICPLRPPLPPPKPFSPTCSVRSKLRYRGRDSDCQWKLRSCRY